MVIKWTRRIVFLFSLLPVLALAATPDLVLKDFNGKDRNVNEYIGQGKWTVVMIWAHDCPVCNAEVDQMVFFHDEHYKKDANVLGVTIDGMENKAKAQDFIDRHLVSFPNLIAEPEAAVIAKFGGGPFIGTPTFYIYNPKGELVGRQVGPLSQETLERFLEQQKKGGAET